MIKRMIKYGIIEVFATIIVLFCFLSLIGCTKTLYVPIESVKTEYRDRLLRDSIYEHDSVYVVVKGDTVWIDRFKYLYRDRIVHDSIFINDSIRVPYPVEKPLSRWEKMKMDVGGWAIGLLSGIFLTGIGYIIVWLIRRKRV